MSFQHYYEMGKFNIQTLLIHFSIRNRNKNQIECNLILFYDCGVLLLSLIIKLKKVH